MRPLLELLNKKQKVSDIKYIRSLLMGFAILWVMSFHYPFIPLQPLLAFEHQGYVGVDIFMFVSGFGIYYSLNKNNLGTYYRNRFKRILPTYAIMATSLFLYWFLQNKNICYIQYLIETWWYIPCICTFYVMSPVIYKIINSNLFVKSISISGGVIFIAVYLLSLPHYIPINLSVGRLPIYIIGMFMGKLSLNERTLKIKDLLLMFVTGCTLYSVSYLFSNSQSLGDFRTLRFFAYAIIIPSLVLLFGCLKDNESHIARIFQYLGKISLELYLVSVFIWQLLKDFHIEYNTFSISIYVLGSLLIALGLSKISRT